MSEDARAAAPLPHRDGLGGAMARPWLRVWLRRPRLAATGVLVIACVVRVATLGQESFWYDEAATLRDLDTSLGDVVTRVADDEATPPLYFVAARVWTQVFGDSEVGIRLLSAVLGVATVALVMTVCRRLADWPTALLAGALTALNPFLIYYSQEARAYSLRVLLTFASVASALVAVRENRPGYVALWALTASASLLTHYFAAFIVLPTALWLFLSFSKRRTTTLAVASVGLVGIAILPMLVAQRRTGRTDWVTASPLHTRLLNIPEHLLAGPEAWRPILLTAVALLGVAAVAAAWLSAGRSRTSLAVVLAGLVACEAGTALAAARLGVDAILPRNFSPAAPLLVVGIALTAMPSLRSQRKHLRIASSTGVLLVFVVAVAGIVAPLVDSSTRRRPDWRATAATLVAEGPADVVVLVPRSNRLPLSVYLPLRTEPLRTVEAQRVAVVRRLIDVGGRPEPLARLRRLRGFTVRRARPSPEIETLVYTAGAPQRVSVKELRRVAQAGQSGIGFAAPAR